MALRIIGGKFIKDGVEQKPEFGNTEQIALLKKCEEIANELKDGMVVDYGIDEISGYESTVEFDCLCGGEAYRTVSAKSDDDTKSVNNLTIPCKTCKRVYKTQFNEEGDLTVKLA